MSLEDISALGSKIQQLATPDCALYLWATSPKLIDATTVLTAWGFNYRSSMVWVKDRQGLGYWARQRHELLLIAVRGHPLHPAETQRPDSVIEAPRRGHSGRRPPRSDIPGRP